MPAASRSGPIQFRDRVRWRSEITAGDDFEGHAAGQWRGGQQSDLDAGAKLEEPTPAPADQGMAAFVVIIEIARQAADRDQPIGAAIVQSDEQAEAGDAGDAARKDLAD